VCGSRDRSHAISIACIIATSALAADATVNRSFGGVPYANRAWLLRNVILPCYVEWSDLFSEIIVVGEWEFFPGTTWLDFPSIYGNASDALVKRQAGYDALQRKDVEWVLFQHDDHLYAPDNPYPMADADVLAPSRFTRARSGVGEQLNDGSTYGYVNGHGCLMRPSCFTRGFSWAGIPPTRVWDVAMTERLTGLGLTWAPAPQLKLYDMEAGASPWV